MYNMLAHQGTFGLDLVDGAVVKHPVVGWSTHLGTVFNPIYAAEMNCRAVLFPDGSVTDRKINWTYPDLETWVSVVEGSGEEVQTSSPVGRPVVSEEESPLLSNLELSGRAVAPLKRMGVLTLAQVAVQSRDDIAAVKGVSDSSMAQLDALLKQAGLSWEWEPETVSDTGEEDDLEDVL